MYCKASQSRFEIDDKYPKVQINQFSYNIEALSLK